MFNETQIRDKVGTTLLTLQSDLFRDPALVLSLLTRLPIKLREADYERSARAAWAYPLVGLITGGLVCLATLVALWIGLPLWACTIITISTGIIVTGAMHEDGLADCADGFWGGWDPAMRLKIMKDSQIGTYGVLVLLTSQALRFGAILEILSWEDWALPLIAVHVASRAAMPALMRALPHARDTGLSRSVGNVTTRAASVAAAIGAIALILAFGSMAIVFVGAALLAAVIVGRIAQAKIGGQTGDVCGASQQVVEISLLLTAIAAHL